MMTYYSIAILVTDPLFSKLYANLLYGQVFPENWKKMKNFDIEGARVPTTPFPSVNVCYLHGLRDGTTCSLPLVSGVEMFGRDLVTSSCSLATGPPCM